MCSQTAVNSNDLETEILLLEIDNFESMKDNDVDKQVERDEKSINQYGSESQKKELQELKRQMDAEKDQEVRKYIADRIASLSNYVFNNSFEWLKKNYILIHEGG